MLSGKDFIFCSYCFDNSAAGDYYTQQVRLRESIVKLYPDATLHFKHEDEATGKPKFQQSLYGYKVQLVKECLEMGFKKIIYFDSAICLEKKVDYWFDLAKDLGVLTAVDRQTLNNVISDKCKKFSGLSDEELSKINLVGGSIYVFDFDNETCKRVFQRWQEMESLGLFGSQEDCTNGTLGNHRMDETCMALALNEYGLKGLGHDVMRYAYEHPETKQIHGQGYEPVCIKRHFK